MPCTTISPVQYVCLWFCNILNLSACWLLQEPGSPSALLGVQDSSLRSQQPANAFQNHTDQLFHANAGLAEQSYAQGHFPQNIASNAAASPLQEHAESNAFQLSSRLLDMPELPSQQRPQLQHPDAVEQHLPVKPDDMGRQRGNSTDLDQHVSVLRQQLSKSHDTCCQLEAAVTALESKQAVQQQQYDQQLRSARHQHQQQMKSQQQQLSQQQTQLGTESSRADSLQQHLQASHLQAQSLQMQVSQQQGELSKARSRADIELGTAQHQLKSAQDALATQQDKAGTYLRQQLQEQQQDLQETQRLLRSTQAELSDVRAELESSQQNLLSAQQQAVSTAQSSADRDAAWQEELQQQQAESHQLQAVSCTISLAVILESSCHSGNMCTCPSCAKAAAMESALLLCCT